MIAKNNNSLFTTDSSNSKYPNKGMTLTQKEILNMNLTKFGFIENLNND